MNITLKPCKPIFSRFFSKGRRGRGAELNLIPQIFNELIFYFYFRKVPVSKVKRIPTTSSALDCEICCLSTPKSVSLLNNYGIFYSFWAIELLNFLSFHNHMERMRTMLPSPSGAIWVFSFVTVLYRFHFIMFNNTCNNVS